MAERGRLAFSSAEELQAAVDQYFDSCLVIGEVDEESGDLPAFKILRPPTLVGLSAALGINRRTLLRYGDKGELSHVVSRARERVEEFAEMMLYSKEGHRGAAFTLAVNFGWGREDDDGPDDLNGESPRVQRILPPRELPAPVMFEEGD
jgi:hypothetical protein